MKILEKLSFPWIPKDKPRDRCWIIGAGPTLDDCDLSVLKGEYIFAGNAAIHPFVAAGIECWWVAHQHPVLDECNKAGNPRNLITRSQNIESLKKTRMTIYQIPKDSKFKKCSTVTQLSVLFAVSLGFKQVCLVGIDLHDKDGIEYASCTNKTVSRASVYCRDDARRKKTREWKYHRDNCPIQFVTTSHLFPIGLFRYIPFGILAAQDYSEMKPLDSPEPVDVSTEYRDDEIFGMKWKNRKIRKR